MLALRVTVPIACFRKGFAREFWETEDLPPPSTCYGFLLSMVGEYSRSRHLGVRVCPALLSRPQRSTVLRTLWRFKERRLGGSGNQRPDYQELLTGVDLAIWIDSSEETQEPPHLEARLIQALDDPRAVVRQSALCLGESTHMIDQVTRLDEARLPAGSAEAYLLSERGRLPLPVWVDHVGSSRTRYVMGNLETLDTFPPQLDRMPRIERP